MLEALMKVVFFPKTSDSCKEWPGYDAQRTLMPAFNLGGELFSGMITSDEKMYYWNTEYLTFVSFFTIDNHEVYSKVEHSLTIGKTYHIQIASKIIGKATLLDYSYT